MADIPDHTHPDHGCPAMTTTPSGRYGLFCTRDLGHEPPHQATGVVHGVLAEWSSPDREGR